MKAPGLWLAPVILCICAGGAVMARGAEVTPYTEIFRVPLPEKLPPHPRLLCTADEVEQVRKELEKGDEFTTSATRRIVARAEGRLAAADDLQGTPGRDDFRAMATLATAWILTEREEFGVAARDMLLWAADVCQTLETTRSRGRFTSSTLTEGRLAVWASQAYDLIAPASFISNDDRTHIEDDLLKVLGYECGHKCWHANSSNWRSWALTIIASTGFATGDRALMEEAINGTYNEDRKLYQYGIVQQLTHSIFADGIHWERSMGYTYYTASALRYVLEIAKNSGIDLWHADLPGLQAPFEGSAGHEEYGLSGNRSMQAFLDAPFYFAFPDLSFPRIGDSGTRHLTYHPIYEQAWTAYRDPKYAWLINRHRTGNSGLPEGWSLWRPSGEPEGAIERERTREGAGFRLKTDAGERAALVQRLNVPASEDFTVSAWVKPLAMNGGSAHIRCNWNKEYAYSERVRKTGDWREISCTVPGDPEAEPEASRRISIHLFMESGAGEVIWDEVTARIGDEPARVTNPGFEAVSDGRDLDFWGLFNTAEDVPEGHFSLADDAEIGLAGRHVNGCTLFEVGGFAIMRTDPTDEDALAVNLTYGPYGSGHCHPDRLQISVYGLNKILCPDAGSWGYDNPMHLTWANQTIAHNTMVVDEISQYPQQDRDGIWASEQGDRRVFGVLRAFHPGEVFKTVRATCDSAYEGVMLDRTVCATDEYVLDVFSASSEQTHTYDLPLHAPGEVLADGAGEPEDNPFDARGYEHLENVRRLPASNTPAVVEWNSNGRALRMTGCPGSAQQYFLAKDPAKSGVRSCCIGRVQGTDARFVTLLQAAAEEPQPLEISREQSDGANVVTVSGADFTDTITIPDDTDADIEMVRTDAKGAVAASETAVSVQEE